MSEPASSVDAYLAAQTDAVRALLAEVRAAIRNAVPKAAESISYKIPTYKLNGRAMLYFAGWKKHYALYPVSPEILAACAKDLAPFEIEKGTIRFPLGRPVPARLIARIAKLRAQELNDAAKAKAD
ncbi:hypothetical protein sos41_18760 [Alphaproteobacteria bacterium SO-S41]|nr:hypothetical protein sos41_18760 [Alphaproteobacteria bacterium SO-S41]